MVMSDEATAPSSGPISFEHEGWQIESTGTPGMSAKEAEKAFRERAHERAVREAKARGETPPEPPKTEEEEASEAAAKLGKKGGEAAAKARKAKPIKELPKKEAKAEEAEEESAEEPESEEDEDEGAKAKRELDEEIKAAKPHEKKRLASDRVAEATRESAELKRKVARLEKELQAARQPVPPQIPPAPNKAQYGGRDEEYQAAEQDYRVQRAVAEQDYRRQHQQALQVRQAQMDAFREEREAVFAQDYQEALTGDPEAASRISERIAQTPPHYDIEENQSPTAENFISSEIMFSEHPYRLARYLSEHQEEYQRLAALQSPRAITRAVAIIEKDLSALTGQPSPKPSVPKAPSPVRPVSGAPHTAERGYRPGMPFEEYAALRIKDFVPK